MWSAICSTYCLMIKPLILFLDQNLCQLPFIVHMGKQSEKKDNTELVQQNSSNHFLFHVFSESDCWQKLPGKRQVWSERAWADKVQFPRYVASRTILYWWQGVLAFRPSQPWPPPNQPECALIILLVWILVWLVQYAIFSYFTLHSCMVAWIFPWLSSW